MRAKQIFVNFVLFCSMLLPSFAYPKNNCTKLYRVLLGTVMLGGAVGIGLYTLSGDPDESDTDFEQKWSISDGEILFLIEGMNASEVAAAKTFLEDKKATVFDTIHSYDPIHLSYFIRTGGKRNQPLNEDEQKLLALTVITFFSKRTPPWQVSLKTILPVYSHMVKEGQIEEIPQWVKTLVNQTDAIIGEVLEKELAIQTVDQLKTRMRKLSEESLAASNMISGKALLQFLENKPNAKKVYALIGKDHLKMIQNIPGAEIKSRSLHKIVAVIPVKNRKVELRLYGGLHDDEGHWIDLYTEFHRGDSPQIPHKGDQIALSWKTRILNTKSNSIRVIPAGTTLKVVKVRQENGFDYSVRVEHEGGFTWIPDLRPKDYTIVNEKP